AGTLDVIGAWETPADTGAPETEIQTTTNGPTAEAIRAWLTDRVARKLRVTADALDPRQPLARYGLDSLTAVQLAGELERWLGRPLSPVLVYDHPTIDDLARHLSGERRTLESKQLSAAPARPSDEPIAVVGIGCR